MRRNSMIETNSEAGVQRRACPASAPSLASVGPRPRCARPRRGLGANEIVSQVSVVVDGLTFLAPLSLLDLAAPLACRCLRHGGWCLRREKMSAFPFGSQQDQRGREEKSAAWKG